MVVGGEEGDVVGGVRASFSRMAYTAATSGEFFHGLAELVPKIFFGFETVAEDFLTDP